MKATTNWLVLRGQHGWSLQECSQKAEDLGRREHVVKVLLEAFRGATVDGEDILWVQPTFELRFKPEASARPRQIDVAVTLDGIEHGDVISAISTKARGQLQERRFWQFFDAETGQAIHWNRPKRRPLSKKGLVTVEISSETFLRRVRSGPGAHLLLSLSAASEVDAFMHRAPLEPKDAVTFGWENLELITPLGTRLFDFHFGGQGYESAKYRVQEFAVELGCSIATLESDVIVVSGRAPEIVRPTMCKALLHDVLEDSLNRGGLLWRQSFVSFNPDRPEATRHVATVTFQQSIEPAGVVSGGHAG
ncbi:hypothetical protein [Solimonas fluminis]|uniref:hypothetical protein n=1 Tax=Solimonas fluminis TaxID=2086571 RepID=UPI0010574916|nr:hypothetical protein [Solimonas fluminis]